MKKVYSFSEIDKNKLKNDCSKSSFITYRYGFFLIFLHSDVLSIIRYCTLLNYTSMISNIPFVMLFCFDSLTQNI